ncbi:MAG: ATP-dependent DNA helicase PcrA [Candidatus Vogelbacteria bacterium CG10_big_fil_rev_8_21_14_0_10_45_14]|uniref:DNA 3'-5' helicase n=1 Tax=Candidatus Vogelbacteria bacterium CG10_big_fil_rev_8_21_14_0_10_45_14 TaxID=1975042 RepID=A0A2H0RMH9_9BACT|nr:MAG: ATP-dependent DNA helicase PcrA [Candidatus Vogelbacteria bacterium CG10_big_fil_rev_8_21_14_0_10_45_14]
MSAYLNDLNEMQREAVVHKDGPLLILAGAGAGKTRTIAYRILHLVAEGVPSESILAITFTNKAARELKERVSLLLKEHLSTSQKRGGEPTICTFHSLGVQMIKRYAGSLGLTRWFTILDRDESLAIIKRAIKKAGLDPKDEEPKSHLAIISREKARLHSWEDFAKDANGYQEELATRIWADYEKEKQKSGALDFDDLIVRPVSLLQSNVGAKRYYEELYPYLHIDEYQDTNTAQFEFARLLSGKNRNICVVGDGDQSVYGWREADYRNILNFETHYEGARTVLLEENYRSTQNILCAANSIIAQNTLRKEKNLFTKGVEGEKIVLYGALDGVSEARYVAKTCERLLETGVLASEIAVLYRANFLSRSFEEAFLSLGIPYHIVGTAFYERKEVKDTLAYIRASVNKDDMVSFARIVNTPRRGIGSATLDAVLAGREEGLSSGAREKLYTVRRILAQIREQADRISPSALVRITLKVSGLEKMLSENIEDEERLENARELATLASRYDSMPIPEGLERYLSDTALLSDQDSLTDAKDGVRLMTVHASKGLEFGHVFSVGLEEGLFPHARRDARDEQEALEEERRLFYVAVTRAKERLTISYAMSRMVYGTPRIGFPSQFLDDIPEEVVAREGNATGDGARLSTDTHYTKEDDDDIEWNVLKSLKH